MFLSKLEVLYLMTQMLRCFVLYLKNIQIAVQLK